MYADNEGVMYLEDTDSISPLNATLNTLQAATSDVISSTTRIFPVANVTARDALVSKYPPTTARPLVVWRSDAAAGAQLEYTTNGTTWNPVVPAPPAWQSLNLAGTWEPIHGAVSPQFRVVDGMCYLRGTVFRGGGVTGGAFSLLATGLPSPGVSSGSYPLLPVGVGRLSGDPLNASAVANPRSDGGLRVAVTSSISSNVLITLDGASYRVSA